ncbi:hypothetical protein RUM44_003564 [Polyplax serrata]|uniref:Uncharacterized protein n=1 Tax=Polyplax serrata TaxID=468196 RepID=A0ABR1AGT7_POLSC
MFDLYSWSATKFRFRGEGNCPEGSTTQPTNPLATHLNALLIARPSLMTLIISRDRFGDQFQKPGKVMKLKLNRAKVMKTDELLDKRRETKREREIKTKEEIRDERKTEREENNGEKKRGFAQRKKPTPK